MSSNRDRHGRFARSRSPSPSGSRSGSRSHHGGDSRLLLNLPGPARLALMEHLDDRNLRRLTMTSRRLGGETRHALRERTTRRLSAVVDAMPSASSLARLIDEVVRAHRNDHAAGTRRHERRFESGPVAGVVSVEYDHSRDPPRPMVHVKIGADVPRRPQRGFRLAVGAARPTLDVQAMFGRGGALRPRAVEVGSWAAFDWGAFGVSPRTLERTLETRAREALAAYNAGLLR